MPPSAIPLPPDAMAAVARGQTVEAIRIVREATGLGLREARDAVEAHAARMQPSSQDAGTTTGFVFPEVAAAAIARGEFINAIALLRKANPRLDLKAAKEAVEGFRLDPARASGPTKRNVHSQYAARVPTVVAGDSGRHGLVLLVVVVALAALAWWWVGGP